GQNARLVEMCLLTGGIINNTVSIKLADGRAAVMKVTDHRVNHDHLREARQLQLLASFGIPVPSIYAVETASLEQPHSFVLMEKIEGYSLRELRGKLTPDQLDRIEHELAEIVMKLHDHTAEAYGKFEEKQYKDWPSFYASLVDPVVGEAQRLHCLPEETNRTIRKVHDHLDTLLAHLDVPRLLHGDLWTANIICRQDQHNHWRIAAIIDPELRHGHAEAELAYLELFRTVTPAFTQAYNRHFKRDDDYERRRKPIYQLYGLINQLQLQGARFAPQVIEASDHLAKAI
ncbi:MAG TPA: fructosamine kinase family protein, partial [Tepidisphaeraceae bacterium]|nr:fructosamine kinase family protein [Tepidisphaeraceae bacterium]